MKWSIQEKSVSDFFFFFFLHSVMTCSNTATQSLNTEDHWTWPGPPPPPQNHQRLNTHGHGGPGDSSLTSPDLRPPSPAPLSRPRCGVAFPPRLSHAERWIPKRPGGCCRLSPKNMKRSKPVGGGQRKREEGG